MTTSLLKTEDVYLLAMECSEFGEGETGDDGSFDMGNLTDLFD